MMVRKAAVQCLQRILYGHARADTMLAQAESALQQRERRFLHELVYGVLRRRYSLEADFSRFCKRKPDELSAAALLAGAYQLRHMRVPGHAAVSETVAAIRQLNPKAAGFVNALLRRVAESAPPAKLKPGQRAELPKWMYASWRDAFGGEAVQSLGEALKTQPALCVAVFVDRAAWIEQVRAMGVAAEAGRLSPYAVLLPAGTAVTQLPGFDAGAFIVMDQAAQAAVLALQLADPAGRIIDLCAAPGGKSMLLARRFPKAEIVAVEIDGRRMSRLRENLCRVECPNISLVQADALRLPLADGSADAVLLDAPCSASGILRRHPDAKFLHSAEGVQALSVRQRRMTSESLRLLKTGGRMIYAVCSIHPEENEQVLAGVDGVSAMQRLLPAMDHDGFFHAVIEKRSVGQ